MLRVLRCRGEATPRKGVVTPREVQLQIFQRSFSTKGPGRGIGTYSIKLLTECYLGGNVGFASTEAGGTIFRVDLPVNSQPA